MCAFSVEDLDLPLVTISSFNRVLLKLQKVHPEAFRASEIAETQVPIAQVADLFVDTIGWV